MLCVNWYQIDAAFKLRMAYLGEKLTYEERLQRVEELLWMRDELLKLVEEKDNESTVFDFTDATKATASTGGKAQLVSPEGTKWEGHQASNGWINADGSRGSCPSSECLCKKPCSEGSHDVL